MLRQVLLYLVTLRRAQFRSSPAPVRQGMRVAGLAPPSHDTFEPAPAHAEDLGQPRLTGLMGVNGLEYLPAQIIVVSHPGFLFNGFILSLMLGQIKMQTALGMSRLQVSLH
ncbi:MAG: hypothetical protein JOZ45_06930 [Acidobacteriaceae bacterium]|nr:hypothetical protein [Acidobacteriaceae bacterium]